MKKIDSMIPFLRGGVLGFGIKDEDTLKAIEKNKKIIACDLIESISINKEKSKGFKRKISFRKLKKRYCNKKVDFIIVNESEMKYLEKKLIPFYIDACVYNIYIYGDYQLEKISKRFKRYNALVKDEDGVLVISLEGAKHKRFKDPFYYVYDTVIDIFDILSDFLVS